MLSSSATLSWVCSKELGDILWYGLNYQVALSLHSVKIKIKHSFIFYKIREIQSSSRLHYISYPRNNSFRIQSKNIIRVNLYPRAKKSMMISNLEKEIYSKIPKTFTG
ncbi:hypothetical protein ACKWTF_013974 [Chironomus riparius]